MKVKHLNVQAAGCDHVDLFAKNAMELLAVWPGPATLCFLLIWHHFHYQGNILTLFVESGLALRTLSFGTGCIPALLLVSSTASARSSFWQKSVPCTAVVMRIFVDNNDDHIDGPRGFGIQRQPPSSGAAQQTPGNIHSSPYFVEPVASTYLLPLLIQVAGLSLHLMQERQIPPDALVILSPSNVPLIKSLTSRKI